MSATPEEIAAELGGMFMRLATETEDEAALRRINTARAAAALIRAQAERQKVLAFALRRLTYWAQTSGGTAGRDDGLVVAIDIAVEALRAHDAALRGEA